MSSSALNTVDLFPKAGWFAAHARRRVHAVLSRLRRGQLTVLENGSRARFGGTESTDDPDVTITVHDPGFYCRLLWRGSLGAGEAYMDGMWDADDLVGVVQLFARHEAVLLGLDSPWSRLSACCALLWHRWRGNTLRGSQANIAAHYDLGNDFYRLWLDETMTYSAGVFAAEGTTLAEASRAKFHRIGTVLGLTSAHRVLEIGCGWGGFACAAARTFGCRVEGITLSREQLAWAKATAAKEGVEDRVEFRLQDYREVRGQYDSIVSIEMIEAVGAAYTQDFFRLASERLKEDGAMLLQAITVPERIRRRAQHSVDFLKAYIFPGSDIPSEELLVQSAREVSDLRLMETFDLTADYARMLAGWRENVIANRAAILSLPGKDERFLRMWIYYLAYCEGSFHEGWNGDAQMLFARPGWYSTGA